MDEQVRDRRTFPWKHLVPENSLFSSKGNLEWAVLCLVAEECMSGTDWVTKSVDDTTTFLSARRAELEKKRKRKTGATMEEYHVVADWLFALIDVKASMTTPEKNSFVRQLLDPNKTGYAQLTVKFVPPVPLIRRFEHANGHMVITLHDQRTELTLLSETSMHMQVPVEYSLSDAQIQQMRLAAMQLPNGSKDTQCIPEGESGIWFGPHFRKSPHNVQQTVFAHIRPAFKGKSSTFDQKLTAQRKPANYHGTARAEYTVSDMPRYQFVMHQRSDEVGTYFPNQRLARQEEWKKPVYTNPRFVDGRCTFVLKRAWWTPLLGVDTVEAHMANGAQVWLHAFPRLEEEEYKRVEDMKEATNVKGICNSHFVCLPATPLRPWIHTLAEPQFAGTCMVQSCIHAIRYAFFATKDPNTKVDPEEWVHFYEDYFLWYLPRIMANHIHSWLEKNDTFSIERRFQWLVLCKKMREVLLPMHPRLDKEWKVALPLFEEEVTLAFTQQVGLVNFKAELGDTTSHALTAKSYALNQKDPLSMFTELKDLFGLGKKEIKAGGKALLSQFVELMERTTKWIADYLGNLWIEAGGMMLFRICLRLQWTQVLLELCIDSFAKIKLLQFGVQEQTRVVHCVSELVRVLWPVHLWVQEAQTREGTLKELQPDPDISKSTKLTDADMSLQSAIRVTHLTCLLVNVYLYDFWLHNALLPDALSSTLTSARFDDLVAVRLKNSVTIQAATAPLNRKVGINWGTGMIDRAMRMFYALNVLLLTDSGEDGVPEWHSALFVTPLLTYMRGDQQFLESLEDTKHVVIWQMATTDLRPKSYAQQNANFHGPPVSFLQEGLNKLPLNVAAQYDMKVKKRVLIPDFAGALSFCMSFVHMWCDGPSHDKFDPDRWWTGQERLRILSLEWEDKRLNRVFLGNAHVDSSNGIRPNFVFSHTPPLESFQPSLRHERLSWLCDLNTQIRDSECDLDTILFQAAYEDSTTFGSTYLFPLAVLPVHPILQDKKDVRRKNIAFLANMDKENRLLLQSQKVQACTITCNHLLNLREGWEIPAKELILVGMLLTRIGLLSDTNATDDEQEEFVREYTGLCLRFHVCLASYLKSTSAQTGSGDAKQSSSFKHVLGALGYMVAVTMRDYKTMSEYRPFLVSWIQDASPFGKSSLTEPMQGIQFFLWRSIMEMISGQPELVYAQARAALELNELAELYHVTRAVSDISLASVPCWSVPSWHGFSFVSLPDIHGFDIRFVSVPPPKEFKTAFVYCEPRFTQEIGVPLAHAATRDKMPAYLRETRLVFATNAFTPTYVSCVTQGDRECVRSEILSLIKSDAVRFKSCFRKISESLRKLGFYMQFHRDNKANVFFVDVWQKLRPKHYGKIAQFAFVGEGAFSETRTASFETLEREVVLSVYHPVTGELTGCFGIDPSITNDAKDVDKESFIILKEWCSPITSTMTLPVRNIKTGGYGVCLFQYGQQRNHDQLSKGQIFFQAQLSSQEDEPVNGFEPLTFLNQDEKTTLIAFPVVVLPLASHTGFLLPDLSALHIDLSNSAWQALIWFAAHAAMSHHVCLTHRLYPFVSRVYAASVETASQQGNIKALLMRSRDFGSFPYESLLSRMEKGTSGAPERSFHDQPNLLPSSLFTSEGHMLPRAITLTKGLLSMARSRGSQVQTTTLFGGMMQHLSSQQWLDSVGWGSLFDIMQTIPQQRFLRGWYQNFDPLTHKRIVDVGKDGSLPVRETYVCRISDFAFEFVTGALIQWEQKQTVDEMEAWLLKQKLAAIVHLQSMKRKREDEGKESQTMKDDEDDERMFLLKGSKRKREAAEQVEPQAEDVALPIEQYQPEDGWPRVFTPFMGAGKSQVMIPLLVLRFLFASPELWGDRSIFLVVVPTHLARNTWERIATICNWYFPHTSITIAPTTATWSFFALPEQKERQVIVSTDMTLKHALVAAPANTRHALKKCFIVMDEVDMMYNPITSEFNQVNAQEQFTKHPLMSPGSPILPILNKSKMASVWIENFTCMVAFANYSKVISSEWPLKSETGIQLIENLAQEMDPELTKQLSKEPAWKRFVVRIDLLLRIISTQLHINKEGGLVSAETSREFLAVPFLNGNPDPKSKYSDPDLSAIMTCLCYAHLVHNGARFPRKKDTARIRAQLLYGKDNVDCMLVLGPELVEAKRQTDGKWDGSKTNHFLTMTALIRDANLLDATELFPWEMAQWYAIHLVLRPFMTFPREQDSSPFSFLMHPSVAPERTIGLSGTATRLPFREWSRAPAHGIDQRMRTVMATSRYFAELKKNSEEGLKAVLQDKENAYSILIDCGAILRNKTLEQSLKWLAETIKGCILYVDPDTQQLMRYSVLYASEPWTQSKEQMKVLHRSTQYDEKVGRFLLYYDYAHIVGTDIRYQPTKDMRALCTVDFLTTRMTELSQATFRIRSLLEQDDLDLSAIPEEDRLRVDFFGMLEPTSNLSFQERMDQAKMTEKIIDVVKDNESTIYKSMVVLHKKHMTLHDKCEKDKWKGNCLRQALLYPPLLGDSKEDANMLIGTNQQQSQNSSQQVSIQEAVSSAITKLKLTPFNWHRDVGAYRDGYLNYDTVVSQPISSEPEAWHRIFIPSPTIWFMWGDALAQSTKDVFPPSALPSTRRMPPFYIMWQESKKEEEEDPAGWMQIDRLWAFTLADNERIDSNPASNVTSMADLMHDEPWQVTFVRFLFRVPIKDSAMVDRVLAGLETTRTQLSEKMWCSVQATLRLPMHLFQMDGSGGLQLQPEILQAVSKPYAGKERILELPVTPAPTNQPADQKKEAQQSLAKPTDPRVATSFQATRAPIKIQIEQSELHVVEESDDDVILIE